MRIGIVRTDLGRGVYLADLASHNQYPYANGSPGEARTLRRPTDAEWDAALGAYPIPVLVVGTDTAATVDTTSNDTLRIRANPGDAFTVIAVTAGGTTAKTTIESDLNTAFGSNNLPFLASIVGTNQLQIESTITGPTAYLEIDTVANGSTLSTAVGFAAGGVVLQGASLASLRAAVEAVVYSGTTFDVSEANIISADAGFAELSAGDQTALATAIADIVAPQFVESGDVLLSFASGVLSVLRDANYRPDGDRVGLPVGEAVYATENDGSTAFTYP